MDLTKKNQSEDFFNKGNTTPNAKYFNPKFIYDTDDLKHAETPNFTTATKKINLPISMQHIPHDSEDQGIINIDENTNITPEVVFQYVVNGKIGEFNNDNKQNTKLIPIIEKFLVQKINDDIFEGTEIEEVVKIVQLAISKRKKLMEIVLRLDKIISSGKKYMKTKLDNDNIGVFQQRYERENFLKKNEPESWSKLKIGLAKIISKNPQAKKRSESDIHVKKASNKKSPCQKNLNSKISYIT